MDTGERRIQALFAPLEVNAKRWVRVVVAVARAILIVTFYVGTLLILFAQSANGTW